LLIGSVLGVVNSVLAAQPNIGQKPIIEPRKVIVPRCFGFPAPAVAQN